MKVHYLEIVSLQPDSQRDAIQHLSGITFSDPVGELGNAVCTTLPDGSQLGIRAPMHEKEEPVVRPYFLCEDIESKVEHLSNLGAEIMHPPMDIPGHGKFAVYILGGVQQGLWQL